MKPGCFVYKVHYEQRHVEDCIRSLTNLAFYYLHDYPTDVIGFYEDGLSQCMRDMIVERSGVPVQWHRLELDIPDHIDKTQICCCSIDYMNMCRFMANGVFQHPALDDYEYHCRLDTDSFILSSVRQDIFKTFKNNGWWYGYIFDHITEYPAYYVGLRRATEDFLKLCPSQITRIPLAQLSEGGLYYSNFEVCYRPWFRSYPWTAYADHVDRTGGHYYHRWTDCTVRYMGVRLFMPEERIARVEFIHYDHQQHVFKPAR